MTSNIYLMFLFLWINATTQSEFNPFHFAMTANKMEWIKILIG